MPGSVITGLFAALIAWLSSPSPLPAPAPIGEGPPSAVPVEVPVPAPILVPRPRVPIPEAARAFQRMLTAEAQTVFGIRAPIATLAAQLHQESAWKADARSRVGALGLAQFMPATAADMARIYPRELGAADPLNAAWAVKAQVRYMRDLNRAVKPIGPGELTECAVWRFGLRAYNGGLGWINRERRLTLANKQNPDDPVQVERWNAGRSAGNHRENTEYPRRIIDRITPAYVAASWGRGITCED